MSSTPADPTGQAPEATPEPTGQAPAAVVPPKAASVESLQEEITRLRAENARARVDAKTTAAEEARKELADQVAKALGIGDQVDPAKLAEQASSATRALQESQRELAVIRAAGRDVNYSRLLDSRRFLESIRELDPTQQDKFEAAVKDAVTADPTLRVTQVVTASSAPHAGGSGERTASPLTLTDALRKVYGS